MWTYGSPQEVERAIKRYLKDESPDNKDAYHRAMVSAQLGFDIKTAGPALQGMAMRYLKQAGLPLALFMVCMDEMHKQGIQPADGLSFAWIDGELGAVYTGDDEC